MEDDRFACHTWRRHATAAWTLTTRFGEEERRWRRLPLRCKSESFPFANSKEERNWRKQSLITLNQCQQPSTPFDYHSETSPHINTLHDLTHFHSSPHSHHSFTDPHHSNIHFFTHFTHLTHLSFEHPFFHIHMLYHSTQSPIFTHKSNHSIISHNILSQTSTHFHSLLTRF